MKIKITCITILLVTISFVSLSEGNSKGGDGFRATAKQYELKAQAHRDKAKAYSRMAEIKREAASLADAEKWSEIDWAEYYELDAQVSGSHKTKH